MPDTDDVDLETIDLDPETEEDLEPIPDEPDEGEDPVRLQAAIAKLRKENQRYRERFQPFERIFAGIDEDDAVSIARFAQAYAGGDRQSAVRWLAQNAVTLAGDDLVDVLREHGFTKKEAEKAAAAVDAEQENPTPLRAEDVAKMIAAAQDQARKEAEAHAAMQADVDNYTRQLDAALTKLDIEPYTDAAQAVIDEATLMYNRGEVEPDVDPDDLIAQARRRVLRRSASFLQGEQQRRQKAAVGRPGPDGPAPGRAANSTKDERVRSVEAKLSADRAARLGS